jgi:hypothetical protein
MNEIKRPTQGKTREIKPSQRKGNKKGLFYLSDVFKFHILRSKLFLKVGKQKVDVFF